MSYLSTLNKLGLLERYEGLKNGCERVDFDFINKLVDNFNINFNDLVSFDYKKVKTAFRSTGIQNYLSVFKEAVNLFCIGDNNKDVDRVTIDEPKQTERKSLIEPIEEIIYELRNKFGDDFYKEFISSQNIKIIPFVNSDILVDGVYFNVDQNQDFIFINISSGNFNRIKYTLYHELAHYVFDRGDTVEADGNIFSQQTHSTPELRAMLFAQLSLVPFGCAEEYVLKRSANTLKQLATYGASKRVVTFALFDVLASMGQYYKHDKIEVEWLEDYAAIDDKEFQSFILSSYQDVLKELDLHTEEYNYQVVRSLIDG